VIRRLTANAFGRNAGAGFAWAGVAVLFGLIAVIGTGIDHEAIDWQPALALHQPWRAFTAIGVHYSTTHLAANLAGLLLTAALGIAARVPLRLSAAWLAAWPLTQFGLLIEPTLAHYGGLSGVLHAGVTVVIVFLLVTGTRAQRWVAVIALIGLVGKLIGEAPWGPATRHTAAWDIPIAPLAHATGVIAGAACAIAVLLLPLRQPTTRTT
jgi:rhomboid family GlyGly-CTERM serine protease